MRMKCSLGLGLIVYSCDHAVLKTVNLGSLFKSPPPSRFVTADSCRYFVDSLDRFTSIFPTWLGVIWIICCFLIVHCCSALFMRVLSSLGQLQGFYLFSSRLLSLLYFNSATTHFPCVDTSSLNRNKKKKTHLIITWLLSALFFFKDGADHPWPLNCLSASLHWRPWKWRIVLIKVLKVLNAVCRPDLWWHWRGCGQNFNTVKWTHS